MHPRDARLPRPQAALGFETRADARIVRRSLPRAAHPRLNAIASRLEELAVEANEEHGWGFRLYVGAGGDLAPLQLNRYFSAGVCPPHRDALVGPSTVEVAEDTPEEEANYVRFLFNRDTGRIVEATKRGMELPEFPDDGVLELACPDAGLGVHQKELRVGK